MATKLFCDCGCAREITGPDAGGVPVRFVGGNDALIIVEARVVGPMGSGQRPLNLRPACVQRMVAEGRMEPLAEDKVTPLRAQRRA